MKSLVRFLSYLRGYGWQMAFAVLLILVVTALTLPYPYLFKLIVDNAIPNRDWPLLQNICLLFLGFFLLRGVVAYWNRTLLQRLGMRVCVDLRKDCFAHLQTLSLKFYEKQQTGQIVARVAEDTGSVYALLSHVLVNLISDSVTVVAVAVMLFAIDWRLALATLAVLPFFVINYKMHNRRLRLLSRRHRRHWFKAAAFLTERISSARLVKSFAMEELESARFNRAMEGDFKNYNSVTLYNARLWVVADMISSFGGLLVLFYGGYLAIQGALSVGDLVMCNTLIGFLFSPIVRLSDLNSTVDRAFAGLEKIFEMLDTPSFAAEAKDAVELPRLKGEVEFKGVAFSYDAGRSVLKDLCFKAEPGQMLALVGPSGSGKTTLINLLCRFYDVDAGSILLDGSDIRKAKVRSLRRQIGVVMQDNLLFSDRLIDNLRYGAPDASLEKVIEASRLAGAHDFILRLPHGYDSVVGERGVQLSGGQKQRIAIARAVLADPRILIFDEATSALDSESERHIQAAMDQFTQGRTTFVIAHRLSTVLKADQILVMDKGSIVERGRHDELLAQDGLYRRLYEIQFLAPGALESGIS